MSTYHSNLKLQELVLYCHDKWHSSLRDLLNDVELLENNISFISDGRVLNASFNLLKSGCMVVCPFGFAGVTKSFSLMLSERFLVNVERREKIKPSYCCWPKPRIDKLYIRPYFHKHLLQKMSWLTIIWVWWPYYLQRKVCCVKNCLRNKVWDHCV